MLPLAFAWDLAKPLRVLCLGAHSDDIEIGCGGTILKLCRRYKDIEFYWVVFSAREEQRKQEAIRSAERLLREAAKKTIVLKEFEDTFFPYNGKEIKDAFRQIGHAFQPDVVFTHCRHDLHQDHRLLCELTWNTFRSHLILEYEIPKYDADLGSPNFFVPLDEDCVREKISHLCTSFATQRSKVWFTEDVFRALLRLRGVESGASEKYAEAYYCRKTCLQLNV
jgi:LmbE family N-acetylglucosaminyl deacetylase